jgi:hypothetical protein
MAAHHHLTLNGLVICKRPRDGADLMELKPEGLQISASADPADE